MSPLRRNLIWLLILCLLLTGCWDRREIEERIFVSALGIDHSAEQGDEVTFQIPVPSQISSGTSTGGAGGGGGGNEEPVEHFVEKADTINKATQSLKNKLSGFVFFGYTQLLLIGQEKAERGIKKFVTGIRQHPQFRHDFWPIVVEGEAKKLLTTPSKLESVNAAFIVEMLKAGLHMERIPRVTLHDVLINLSEPSKRNPIMNVIRMSKEGTISWSGIAIFKDERMIDILHADEADVLNHIREQRAGSYMTMPCPKHQGHLLGFRPTKAVRKIQVTDKPSIQIEVNVTGNVNEESCGKQFDRLHSTNKFAKMLAETYEERVAQLIKKAQKQYKTDIFLLGDHIASFHPIIWKQRDWEQLFQTIPIEVKYHVKVNRFNLLIE